jgi:5-methylcytosine-specific restriction endonuclease McrA
MSPIRPENRALYPADWPAISARIRERAGHRCERCGVKNYSRGYRDLNGAFVDVGEDPVAINPVGARLIRIILTVAHLNHDPSDCRDENLEALCQQCHNRHDVENRRAGIIERRRALNRDLFENLANYGGGAD